MQTLTLWDSTADPPGHGSLTYRWNGYADEGSVHSLLRYVERHAERLRARYLAWIHDLGETRILSKRVIDHLAFADDLSYWWLTLVAEKSPYRSPISDAMRLLALEEIVVAEQPGKFLLVSANAILHETLSVLCQKLGIHYTWERLPAERSTPRTLRSLFQTLPHPLRALGTLARYLACRWQLRRAGMPEWSGGDRSRFFCSYFFDTDPKSAERGQFRSRYWDGLPGLLRRLGLSANWLQVFIEQPGGPTPRVAIDWVKRFNAQPREQGFHTFLDAYLSLRVVSRVLRRWSKLMFLSLRLGAIRTAFLPLDSQISLWPLLRADWYASMRGSIAMGNLLSIELFDRALRDLPHQPKGLYLCENIGWERALIHAWRKHGHGQLIAAAVHVSVRFWDLRYFTDPRTLRSAGPHRMPQPDVVALNGKAAIDAYLSADYPKNAIVECEAVRYGGLHDVRSAHPLRTERTGPLRVLILGDFMASTTTRMLRLLEATAPQIPDHISYAVKPHPGFLVKAAEYPSLNLRILKDALPEILQNFDIAYSSNMTSAALDAYLAGLPVVVMLDETKLNLSPLRGHSGVRFVSTSEELAEALRSFRRLDDEPDSADYFFVNPELPKWASLLSN